MAGGDFRAATTVPSATLCPVIRAGPCSPQRLLNWMLALACQQGHLAVVKLLVLTYGADPESYAVRKNEFPVIVRLPLYAAIKSGGSQSASCESLCPVETRARPSHSPLALRWPAWSFAALFLASSSKDLRPPSFRRLPPARGFQCQGPTTADATPLGGAAEGKAPHKCSH